MARAPLTDVHDEFDTGPVVHEILDVEKPVPQERALAGMSQQHLQQMSAVIFQPVLAQPAPLPRTQATVLARIREAAAMGSSDFYYSYPVRKKDGSRDYIEGITIDGAMAVFQAYGNCDVDCREIDIGWAWLFFARFVDYERGTSVVRPHLEPKDSSKIGGVDATRRLQASHNIGASKATRNVIANAIRQYTNFCEEESKNDLVKKVGLKLDEHRKRVLARLAELGIAVQRVEGSFGRAAGDWTAREVAGAITQLRMLNEGLATANDLWPAPPPPEPRRSDSESAAVPSPAAVPPAAETAAEAAAASPAPLPDPAGSEPPPASTQAPPRNWTIPPNIVGQENVIKALTELLDMTESDADQDEFERQNKERIARITGVKGQQFKAALALRRRQRQTGDGDA